MFRTVEQTAFASKPK